MAVTRRRRGRERGKSTMRKLARKTNQKRRVRQNRRQTRRQTRRQRARVRGGAPGLNSLRRRFSRTKTDTQDRILSFKDLSKNRTDNKAVALFALVKSPLSLFKAVQAMLAAENEIMKQGLMGQSIYDSMPSFVLGRRIRTYSEGDVIMQDLSDTFEVAEDLTSGQKSVVESGRITIQKILKSTRANLGLDEDTITIQTIFKALALRRLVDGHIFKEVKDGDPNSSIFGSDLALDQDKCLNVRPLEETDLESLDKLKTKVVRAVELPLTVKNEETIVSLFEQLDNELDGFQIAVPAKTERLRIGSFASIGGVESERLDLLSSLNIQSTRSLRRSMSRLIPDKLMRLNFPNLGIKVRRDQINFEISQGLKNFVGEINKVAQQARGVAGRVAGEISSAAGKVYTGAKDAGAAGLQYTADRLNASAKATRKMGVSAYNKRPLTVATATKMIGVDVDGSTLHERMDQLQASVNQVLNAVETSRPRAVSTGLTTDAVEDDQDNDVVQGDNEN